MQFLSWIQSTFSQCLSFMQWVFGLAGQTTKLPRWFYYLLHYGTVVVVTVLLAWFNRDVLGENTQVRTPLEMVRDYWAGILFLMSYLFIRLLIYFIALLWQEDESEFGDIDRAWAAGEAGLADAGLDIRKVPVFLVNGFEDLNYEPQFFRAAGLSGKVVAPGPEVRSPLRFYASQEALFIACSDVSAVSSQFRAPPIQNAGLTMGAASPDPNQQSSATLRPDQVQQFSGAAASQTMTPAQLNQQATGTLTPNSVMTASPAVGRAGRDQQGIDLRRCERRVKHLCRLIQQSRAPVCPINGLLIAVPLDWTRPSADQSLYQSIKQDLHVLHAGLRMMFPVVCLITGLHQAGAVQELIDRVKQSKPAFGPNVRSGSHFPPALAVDERAAKWIADKGFEWFRDWIYHAFAHDLGNPSNAQLYRMLCNLDEHRAGVVRLLQGSFDQQQCGERVRLSGVYYAGIEPRTRQQAFIRGVVEKLVGEQELVAYPAAFVRHDENCRRWGYVCCLAIFILLCADVWLIVR